MKRSIWVRLTIELVLIFFLAGFLFPTFNPNASLRLTYRQEQLVSDGAARIIFAFVFGIPFLFVSHCFFEDAKDLGWGEDDE